MNKEFLIHNEKDNELHIKSFESKKSCKHWIINNLDLSKNWSFYKDGTFLFDDRNQCWRTEKSIKEDK